MHERCMRDLGYLLLEAIRVRESQIGEDLASLSFKAELIDYFFIVCGFPDAWKSWWMPPDPTALACAASNSR